MTCPKANTACDIWVKSMKQARKAKEKISKGDYIKLKSFCTTRKPLTK